MHLNSELYDGIETVELKITDTARQKYFFPEVPKLRNKLIRRIEVNNQMINTPSNYITQSITNFYLTLVSKGVEIFKDLPLSLLDVSLLSLANLKTELFNHYFDISKSYITISDTSGLTAGSCISITIYYQDPKRVRFVKNIPTFKIDYVEAPVISLTDTVVKINNFKNIQNKRILYVSTFNTGGGTYYTPDGRQIVSSVNILGSYLNLWDNKEEIVKDLPLARILNIYPLQAQIFLRGLQLDWDRCYINVPNSAGLTVGHVFYLPVFYVD